LIKYWKDVDILDMSKMLDDFLLEMLSRHYLMAEGKVERAKA